MLFFCTKCDNLATYKHDKLVCRVCSYAFDFIPPKTVVEHFNNSVTSDILVDDFSQGNFCDVLCPKCSNNRAAFHELQTRSADEAATFFYMCTKCQYKWKIGRAHV